MIDPMVFVIARILLFFIATPFVYKALQAVDFSKFFHNNASDQIRFILMILSVILGYFFVDAILSLVESAAGLF
jgi:uncharacterized integral membrane protein (TIGR02327 family)